MPASAMRVRQGLQRHFWSVEHQRLFQLAGIVQIILFKHLVEDRVPALSAQPDQMQAVVRVGPGLKLQTRRSLLEQVQLIKLVKEERV